ncbi:MAG: hypothetical protein KME64_14995 [Scytonematopsis contorta HA4267-MV1]|jgi:hypothetical protein|nr:hypothetical protein [Scytonematopsis contorta HA4267-MV1]
MTEEPREKENRHAVTKPEFCRKMARKYGWNLKRIERVGGQGLPYECVFEGEQTSFEDMTYDN